MSKGHGSNPSTIMDNNEQDEKNKNKNELITIAGGVNLEVMHLDGSKETVKVRQIPATRLEEFMTKLADEATSVSIYCDKDTKWADTLLHSSIDDICKKGLEINSDFLEAWCRRRATWTEMLNVGVISDLQKQLTTLREALVSLNSAQRLGTTTDSLLRR